MLGARSEGKIGCGLDWTGIPASGLGKRQRRLGRHTGCEGKDRSEGKIGCGRDWTGIRASGLGKKTGATGPAHRVRGARLGTAASDEFRLDRHTG